MIRHKASYIQSKSYMYSTHNRISDIADTQTGAICPGLNLLPPGGFPHPAKDTTLVLHTQLLVIRITHTHCLVADIKL